MTSRSILQFPVLDDIQAGKLRLTTLQQSILKEKIPFGIGLTEKHRFTRNKD